MKRILSLFAAAAVALTVSGAAIADDAAAPAKSQAKTPVVIVIDVNRIMTESAAAKSVQSQVADLRKSLKAEVDAKESSLRSQDEALAQQHDKLSADDFKKKSLGFQQDVMKSRQDVDGRIAALDKAVNVAMGKIEAQLQQILFDMAKEQGANLVLPKAAILVAETSMDMTDQAMARINAKLPSVKVEVGAASSLSAPSQGK
jgi:Skp family chaperone for outer membrane proteins